MTTPFGYPDCCDEVYHCAGEAECRRLQSLVSGEAEDAKIVARFTTRDWFPARYLYKRIFGNYETFLGDVVVVRRDRQGMRDEG